MSIMDTVDAEDGNNTAFAASSTPRMSGHVHQHL